MGGVVQVQPPPLTEVQPFSFLCSSSKDTSVPAMEEGSPCSPSLLNVPTRGGTLGSQVTFPWG